MTDKAVRGLYELKGRLGTRCLSTEHDIDTLRELAQRVETRYFEGHVNGQIRELERLRAQLHGYLNTVCLIIKEIEDVKG